MAAAGNYLRVVFNYQLYSSQTASWSIWYKFATPFGGGGAQTYLNSVINSAYTAGFQAYLKSIGNTGMILTKIDTYVYQPDIKTLFDRGTKAYGDAGTIATQSTPAQVALVISLRTAGFGRAFRGRVYLPWAGGVQPATGRVTTTQTAAATAAFKNFNNVVTAGGDPVLVLNASSRSATSPVTSIIVDGVLDTQRRRRDKLVDPAPSVVTL